MVRVGSFEKVSYKQFKDDCSSNHLAINILTYDRIELPKRSTRGSAGYDFHSPIPFFLNPGMSIVIPTGIKCKMNEGWVLVETPRSSLGFNYRLQMDNTLGIIDSDFYYGDTEGHILLKFTNDSKNNKKVIVEAGDRIAQGIFLPYGITYDDNTTAVRTGGIGSTGK